MPDTKARFGTGRILATPEALQALQDAEVDPAILLTRHVTGDWGDLHEQDLLANEQALKDGSRILSSYTLANDVTVWIITEARMEDGHRAATTLLLPDNY